MSGAALTPSRGFAAEFAAASAEISRADDSHDALYWVDHATRHADEIREVALERLVRNGVLELQDDRFLWIFGSRRYSLADAEVERELKQRIGTVLSSNVIPDPRDIVIITLADGCGLLGDLLSAGELAQVAPRIELVRKIAGVSSDHRCATAASGATRSPTACRLERKGGRRAGAEPAR